MKVLNAADGCKENQSTESTVRRWRRLNVAYYMHDNYCRQKPAAH